MSKDKDIDAAADIEAAWKKEIEQRTAAYERRELETFSSEEVLAEARRIWSDA
jgi:hypothetical protein